MRSGIDDYVAYAEFDLAAIPDSSSIVSVQFNCYQYEVIMMPVRTRCTYPGLDPDSTNDSVLFSAVRNGVMLAQEQSDSVGWVGYDLSAQGVAILRSQLPQDRVTLGIDAVPGGAGVSYGISGYKQTYLHVVYGGSGTYEPSGGMMRQPELAFTPNPICGSAVTARYALAVARRQGLTIRDLVGSAIRTFVLEPSGVTRLNLQGLAPGVYMATIDGTTPLLSRKLIVTAR
jgi:hypothetical protein